MSHRHRNGDLNVYALFPFFGVICPDDGHGPV